MDWVGTSIEIVKLVGGRFVRYLKKQIKYNDLLQQFEQSKQRLCSRKLEVSSARDTQLQSAPYHVVKAEVENWLNEVEEFFGRQAVVDEVNSWGYLSCCCRVVILEERTQELKEIYDRGDKYTKECLVIEDQSKKLNYYMKNFNELKDKLQCKQADIGSKLNSQLVRGKIEMKQVKHWRGKVEEMLKVVRDTEDKIEVCPSHSSDSPVMLLGGKIQEMERMCEEGSQLPDCLVIDDPSASAVELPVSKLQGNEAVKAKLLAYLKGEEVKKLGVWGTGGIGKTTIMKHIYNELQKQPKPKFKKIIWITVSQNFDIYSLPEQIACHLKEQLLEKTDRAMRAGELFQMLKEDKHKPFLLILDDVWQSFDLTEVGIPEPDVTNGCKLVLTTRSQEVARSMGCRRIKVETLQAEEALKLFLNKVGDTVLSDHGGGIKKDLESTLKKIVDECDGLPLAIVTVAGSLKEISEPWLWSAALNQLQDCKRNAVGIDDYAFKILKLIQEMERICEEGSQLPDCLVIDDPLASAVELPASKLQGNEAVKAKISAYLEGEEVAKLGIWGMGGIGKTTIMKHIHNELQKQPKPKFKKIIWVTVSQNFDIYNLQEQIACHLKEQLLGKADKAMRAGELFQMLKEDKHKPFLLILDDVWQSFDLNEVGILEPDVTNGCKLVLTTRSQDVARSMGCRRIKVETLQAEEALKLFLNKVGDSVLSNHGGGIKKDLESTLKKIVDECGGLPLAIVTVAGSLKEISEPWLWSAALNQLQDCKRNVAGTDDDAFKILKFSYDRLKNSQIQYCFLYCALYPEGYNIPMQKIIEDWIDEGFIDEKETWHAMKDEGHDILMNLKDNSMLEYIEDEDEGDCVRMHVLIRDMALHITRTNPRFLVEAGKALRQLPEKVKFVEDVEKVSLMCNYIEEIPSSMASSTCTRLTTLLLAHNKLSTIPEYVFEQMLELKILDVSFNWSLSSLPNSISKLVKLTTLLLESTSLEKVPSLSGLRSLKKLNLRSTKIKEVPDGLGMLTNLKCLYLRGSNNYNILEIDEIADGVLSNLSKLEELIVDWSRIELKGDVVGRLKKLEVFHGRFPTVNDMRIFLQCQPNRLSSYFITVGSNLELKSPYDWASEERAIYRVIEELPRYKRIMVFKEISIVAENMLFPSTQVLCIKACQDIRSLNDFSAIKDAATDLRRCLIWNCDGMECVLSLWINNPVIHTLEDLELYGLHKLDGLFEAKVIAESPPPTGAFSSLKKVEIWSCKKIKKLFPSWNLVEYPSLERIAVSFCEEMEEIIASDPEEEGRGGDIIKELIFPKLKELELRHLPALESICSRRMVMVCNSLEKIVIVDCKGLRRIPFHLPPCLILYELENLDWLPEVELIAMSLHQPSTFSSLKEVKISGCKRANKLFPSWKLVEYLHSLERIYVDDCEKMEEIIGSDPEEGEGGDVIIKEVIFPKLEDLRLISLPALRSICSKRAVMKCDSLQTILIRNCKGLRRIPFRLPPRVSLFELDNLDWVFEGELIAMSPPQPCSFSSLNIVFIQDCKRAKTLFPSWKVVECLQSLACIEVSICEEMEEIIASDPEEEGEGGDIIKKLILPKLKRLELRCLPALKSICSRRAVMVCDSLEEFWIFNCTDLRRIPLCLDNAQPSPPPFLKEIAVRGQGAKWWESLEWDHPNAKDVLRPLLRLYSRSFLESEQSGLAEQSELAEQWEYMEEDSDKQTVLAEQSEYTEEDSDEQSTLAEQSEYTEEDSDKQSVLTEPSEYTEEDSDEQSVLSEQSESTDYLGD